MQAAARKADAAGSEISGGLGRLLNELESLPGGFQGQAALAFQNAKEQMRQDLVKITDALNDLARGIETAGQNFNASDEEAAREVNNAIANMMRG